MITQFTFPQIDHLNLSCAYLKVKRKKCIKLCSSLANAKEYITERSLYIPLLESWYAKARLKALEKTLGLKGTSRAVEFSSH